MKNFCKKFYNLFSVSAFSLMLSVLLLSFCLTLFFGINNYNNKTAKVRTQSVALEVANSYGSMVDNSKIFLSAVSEIYKLNPTDSKKCDEALTNSISSNNMYVTVLVADPQGKVVCGVNKTLKEKFDYSSLSIADRSYFIKSKESKKFVSAGFIIGKISKSKAVIFATPVLDSQGEAIAFAVAAIPVDFIEQTINSLEIPTNIEISVIDQNSIYVTSYPVNEQKTGQEFTNTEAFSTLLNQKITNLEFKNEKGVKSIYSYRPIKTMETFVLVGTPKAGIVDSLKAVF